MLQQLADFQRFVLEKTTPEHMHFLAEWVLQQDGLSRHAIYIVGSALDGGSSNDLDVAVCGDRDEHSALSVCKELIAYGSSQLGVRIDPRYYPEPLTLAERRLEQGERTLVWNVQVISRPIDLDSQIVYVDESASCALVSYNRSLVETSFYKKLPLVKIGAEFKRRLRPAWRIK